MKIMTMAILRKNILFFAFILTFGEAYAKSLSGMIPRHRPIPPPVSLSDGFLGDGTQNRRLLMGVPILFSEAGLTWIQTARILENDYSQTQDFAENKTNASQKYQRRWQTFDVGSFFRKKISESEAVALRLSVGSSADGALRKTRDFVFTGIVDYQEAVNDFERLNYFIFISNNSPFAPFVPIPGFSYSLDYEYHGCTWGFPIASCYWKSPTKSVTAMGSVNGVNITEEVIYHWKDGWKFFQQANSVAPSFFRSDRLVKNDRVFILEKRVGGGLRTQILKNIFLEVYGGYSFDRFFIEQQSYFFRVRSQSTRLPNTSVLELGLRFEI